MLRKFLCPSGVGHIQTKKWSGTQINLGPNLILSVTPYLLLDHIIPIPGLPAGIGGTGSLISATTASVVKNVETTDVAF